MTVTGPLKIIHTVSNTQWGGQERRVFNECTWMAEQGHDIIVATPAGTPLYERSCDMGWQTFPIAFKNATAVADFLALKRILKMIRPHVLNTHGNMDAKLGLLAARQMQVPFKILSRHITPPVKNSWYNRLLYRHLCDLVFTTADCTGQQIATDLGVPEDRIFTVSSGIVVPAQILSRQAAKQMIAGKAGIDVNHDMVGYIGRLDQAKGVSVLIHAFSQIKDAFETLHLVLVGEGGDRPLFERQIRDLGLSGRVHMPGFQKDPWPWYRAFRCKVLASVQDEGIAQSVLEAMFARCPVIATRVGGLPDIVRDNETGLLVPPGDSCALARKIRLILSDSQQTGIRVENAFEFVVQGHTIDAMGQRILSILAAQKSK